MTVRYRDATPPEYGPDFKNRGYFRERTETRGKFCLRTSLNGGWEIRHVAGSGLVAKGPSATTWLGLMMFNGLASGDFERPSD